MVHGEPQKKTSDIGAEVRFFNERPQKKCRGLAVGQVDFREELYLAELAKCSTGKGESH